MLFAIRVSNWGTSSSSPTKHIVHNHGNARLIVLIFSLIVFQLTSFCNGMVAYHTHLTESPKWDSVRICLALEETANVHLLAVVAVQSLAFHKLFTKLSRKDLTIISTFLLWTEIIITGSRLHMMHKTWFSLRIT